MTSIPVISTDTLTPSRPHLGLVYHLARSWVGIFILVFGAYITLPVLAPIFMKLGLTNLGNGIYTIYSTQCHQLPQRSYFLFGPNVMVSLQKVQSVWKNTDNPAILRQFVGNPQLGYKLAWSDRMVSMYGSVFVFALLWWPLRKRIQPLAWWGLALFLLPMALDGGTHFISDLAGIGQGFRDSNAWLAILTHHTFSASFYSGDGWGSFNSIMRIITGVSFGAGLVWFGFPYIEETCQSIAENEAYKASTALQTQNSNLKH